MTPSYPASSSFLHSFILDPQRFIAWKVDCENIKKKNGQTSREKGKRIVSRGSQHFGGSKSKETSRPSTHPKRHAKTKPRVDLQKHDGG